MARKKSGGRREPKFEGKASLDGLRLNRNDRVGDNSDFEDDDAPPARPRREKPEPRERKSGKSRSSRAARTPLRKRFGRVAYWGLVLGLWAMIAAVGAVVWVGAHLPSISSLEIPKRPPTIQIVGTDGSVIATRGEMPGANVALKDLPPYLPNAFIAIEDRRFYSHFGIDPIGIARAAIANVLHRGVSQGGSTLTQQLAKNLFLTQERTLQRKLQEAELALWLERKYGKKEILELYLNRVYFGSGAYGIEAAAQKYFGKPAKNVTLFEAAMLAGLVKSPSRLAPNRNPEGAEKRAGTVLAAMLDAKLITSAQEKAALAHPSFAVKPTGAGTINYVADWIGEVLDDLIGQVDQNIVVETTIDPKLQSVAETAIIDELAAKSVQFNVSQGALVAMTPNGAVRAMVGGRNYAESQFNRAITARRQPGSAFKPFVYLTALETGMTPDTVRQDAPIDVKGWKPENYSHQYFGPVTLTQALAMSLNTVAVRLGIEVGPQNVVRTAHRLGIASKLEPNATISLGTSEVSPTELVGAYATFANNGLAVSPHVITRIKAADTGKMLYVRPADPASQVIDARYVAMMNAMMHETLVIGTAKKADIPGWYAAGKTGTSQDFRDAWFVGYTAHLVTGVWLGNDDSSPTKKATGGGLPVEVWTRFMKAAHQGVAVANLPVPQAGNPVSDFFQSFSRGGSAPAPQQLGPAPSDQASYAREPSYGAGRYSQPAPSRGGNPRPAQTSGRPEADAGLSGGGWLMDRLFGGR